MSLSKHNKSCIAKESPNNNWQFAEQVFICDNDFLNMYTVICICELRFRKRYIAEGGKVEDLKYKVASYPLIPILGICAFVGLFVLSIMDPGQMKGLIICVICYVILYIVSYFYTKKKGIKAANIDI